VLVIKDPEAGRLVIDLGWVDPVRLYALIFSRSFADRTQSDG
jgi:hypothetical protein